MELDVKQFCQGCLHSGKCKYQNERIDDITNKINETIKGIHPYEIIELTIGCMYYQKSKVLN